MKLENASVIWDLKRVSSEALVVARCCQLFLQRFCKGFRRIPAITDIIINVGRQLLFLLSLWLLLVSLLLLLLTLLLLLLTLERLLLTLERLLLTRRLLLLTLLRLLRLTVQLLLLTRLLLLLTRSIGTLLQISAHSPNIGLVAHDADIIGSLVHICKNKRLLQGLNDLLETVEIARNGMRHELVCPKHFRGETVHILQSWQIVDMICNARPNFVTPGRESTRELQSFLHTLHIGVNSRQQTLHNIRPHLS